MLHLEDYDHEILMCCLCCALRIIEKQVKNISVESVWQVSSHHLSNMREQLE